jgi:hypothetical protein
VPLTDALKPLSAAAPNRIDLNAAGVYVEDPRFFGSVVVEFSKWPPDPGVVGTSKWPPGLGVVETTKWHPGLGVVETTKLPPDRAWSRPPRGLRTRAWS